MLNFCATFQFSFLFHGKNDSLKNCSKLNKIEENKGLVKASDSIFYYLVFSFLCFLLSPLNRSDSTNDSEIRDYL